MSRRHSLSHELSMFAAFAINLSVAIFLALLMVAVVSYIAMVMGLIPGGFFTGNLFADRRAGAIAIVFISILLAATVIVVVKRTIIRPVRQIIDAMKELAKGNFDTRVALADENPSPEVREFAESFNIAASELGGIEMMRKDFIDDFSHEFKTPIVSLSGFARMLKEDDLTPEQRGEYLDIIIDESNRLAVLATNVLNLSRVETQTIVADKERFNVGEQIRRVVLMMESKWAEKHLDLDLDLEETSYYGNAELLNQVWVNVLDNAVKFSPQKASVHVGLRDFEDRMVLTVRDSGSGMDENTKTHMFDKFFQGDSSSAAEGNGLGMAMVDRIVCLHGGSTEVRSTLGGGSTITVTLPKGRTARISSPLQGHVGNPRHPR